MKQHKPKKIFVHYKENSTEIKDYTFVHFTKIDKIKNSSVSEIFIQDLLEYIDASLDIRQFILVLMSKLQQNGKIYIQGNDVYNITAALLYKQINILTFKNLVYGFGKKNILSFKELKNLLNDMSDGTITQSKFINGLQYFIEYTKL